MGVGSEGEGGGGEGEGGSGGGSEGGAEGAAAGPDTPSAPTLSRSTPKTASHLSRRVPFILVSMSARPRMRLRGPRFCRAQRGVWEKAVRHRAAAASGRASRGHAWGRWYVEGNR
eukprot:scaffold29516_cov38-Phaeocystis_antarctica.AAC.1